MNAFAHPASDDMADAANLLLQSLTPAQRDVVSVPFTATERQDWHFVPRRRAGLALGDMAPAQRDLALALARSALSDDGLRKASQIMALESVLAEIEGGTSSLRDPGRYHLLVAGTPEVHGTWAWRLEGHHLSLNITIVRGERFAVTPSFFGSNPAEIRTGPRRGERILAAEEDLARSLVLSLDDAQHAVALVGTTAPREILTGAARRIRPLDTQGIALAALHAPQRERLLRLIGVYLERHRSELAAADWEKIRAAGVERIHFAWAGGTRPGEGHYYRVQGPTFLLEYDNTQNGANHIHTVWRDFEGDFGRDLLLEHLQSHHGLHERAR